jgi:excisionase family DNA binding protein
VTGQNDQRDQICGLADQLESRSEALKARELAKLLNYPPATIYRYVDKGIIPYFSLGTSLRFDPKAIAAWLRHRMNYGAH